MEQTPLERPHQAANFIKGRASFRPKVGLVLGSGLGFFARSVKKKEIFDYADIPYFRPCSVDGHRGELIMGLVESIPTAILRGRTHLYEGHSAEQVVFPIRVLAALGVECLILTNAAGGLNPTFPTGGLVVIDDHINLTGANPLLGPRFLDMNNAYDKGLKTIIQAAARELNYPLPSGVYIGVCGPCYETPAETKMMKILGGDMVGMSTVLEAIMARHLGLKVAGLSCISNQACHDGGPTLSHEDVKKQVLQSARDFETLMQKIIVNIG